jgi:hypothetical protein
MLYYRPYLNRKGLSEKEASNMEDNMKEFIAFSRKLLRDLKEIRELLNNGDEKSALVKLNNLIDDTQKDIEA